jgi:inositol phosphorylceramide mannosyltransferase catalytic subunit
MTEYTHIIPKIIHQIWIGANKEPTIWTDTWKIDYITSFPDFEYIFWNDKKIENLLVAYPEILNMYHIEQTCCGKADIARYVILYEHGGIYIDADSVWLKKHNLSTLIDQTGECGMFAAKDTNINKLANSVIGCSKKNPNMLHTINALKDKSYNFIQHKYSNRVYEKLRKISGASTVSGPVFFDKINQNSITIFPSHYFYPVTWHGIRNINGEHEKYTDTDSYMFQYGYTTNNLSDKF